MKPASLVEGLKQLLTILEGGDLVTAGELAPTLERLPVAASELVEARALHARCEALSKQLYDKLLHSVESTGRARRATDAYHDVR